MTDKSSNDVATKARPILKIVYQKMKRKTIAQKQVKDLKTTEMVQ